MAINTTLADDYFGKHIAGAIWNRYTTQQKQAAIEHATRILETILENDIDDDTTIDGDFPRDDCAVYEQALYTLQNAPDLPDSPNATELFGTQEGEPSKRNTEALYKLCKAARFYLCKGQVKLSRT